MTTTHEESALERQVREEDEAHAATLAAMSDADQDPGVLANDLVDAADDPEDDGEPLVDAGGQTALVDRSAYEREDLQIPKIDGETIDRIALKFTGTVFLSRSEASDVAVYNELRFGRDVQLLIDAKCLGVGASGATNKDGDLDVVVSTKGLKVHSISKPAGADWVTERKASA